MLQKNVLDTSIGNLQKDKSDKNTQNPSAKMHTIAVALRLLGRRLVETLDAGCCSSSPFSIGVKLIIFEASPEEYWTALPPAANCKNQLYY